MNAEEAQARRKAPLGTRRDPGDNAVGDVSGARTAPLAEIPQRGHRTRSDLPALPIRST